MDFPGALRAVAFDSQAYPTAGCERLDFFRDVGPTNDSIEQAVDIAEATLVRWLLESQAVGNLIKEVMAFSSGAYHRLELRQPFICDSNSKPGDIDLLICERDEPNQATVIEFKRVKVRGDRVNKVSALGKISDQLDGLCALGFSRTYLGVIVVVDGQNRDYVNFVSRGPTSHQVRKIMGAAGISLPNDELGVLYVEIVQPVGKSINHAGMVCAGIIKAAKPRYQPGDLSDKVKNCIASGA